MPRSGCCARPAGQSCSTLVPRPTLNHYPACPPAPRIQTTPPFRSNLLDLAGPVGQQGRQPEGAGPQRGHPLLPPRRRAAPAAVSAATAVRAERCCLPADALPLLRCALLPPCVLQCALGCRHRLQCCTRSCCSSHAPDQPIWFEPSPCQPTWFEPSPQPTNQPTNQPGCRHRLELEGLQP